MNFKLNVFGQKPFYGDLLNTEVLDKKSSNRSNRNTQKSDELII